MIYIILGTKGQFMKMFPVMKLLDEHKVEYKFIHTCQHYDIIEETRKRLKMRKPDIYLTVKKNDLRSFWEFLIWAPKVLWNARKLSIKRNDYVIIHGDTESTLLGFLIGLYFRAKIVHIEAGLRSGDIFNPFPEEMIRNIASFFADICFCPTEKDAQNIKGKKTVYVTEGNTIFDSISFVMKLKPSSEVETRSGEPYVLFLTHRKESFFSKQRVITILDILEKIMKKQHKVLWILHSNTEYELKAKDLWMRVLKMRSQYDLQLYHNFLNYVDFMHLVKSATFIVSDGGGLQEETYYLNKPLLILRSETERDWGIGETAYLSSFEEGKINYFLENFSRFKRKTSIRHTSPSKIIAGFISKLP